MISTKDLYKEITKYEDLLKTDKIDVLDLGKAIIKLLFELTPHRM